MALGLGIASFALAVGGTAMSVRDRNRDIADQKAIDELNAQNLELESAESEKRLKKSNLRTAGLLRAHASAVGFKRGGSTTAYVEDLVKEGESDLDWMRTSGRSKLGILRAESSARLRLSKAERATGVTSGVSSAVGAGLRTYTAAGGTF